MAEEEGIFLARVGMDRGEQHVAAAPEDLLRAVAVMIVDVEHRHLAGAAVAKGLGGDRGVVEEAIAAIEVAAGVMAGRPAQSEGDGIAGGDQCLAGQRDIGRGGDRGPGAGGDRRAGVEGIVAELAVDGGRHDPPHAGRPPAQRQRVICAVRRHPALPGGGEEIDEAGLVNPPHRVEAELAWRQHLAQFLLAHAGQHDLGPARHLEAGQQLAVDQFRLAVLQPVILAEHGLHRRFPSPTPGRHPASPTPFVTPAKAT